MDTDLYQILTLILLFGLLLTLFGVLQSLGGIRRTLEGGGTPAAMPAPEPATDTVRAADEEPKTWARPAETEPERTDYGTGTTSAEPTRTGWPAPQEAAASAEPATSTSEPAASSGGGARVLYGDAGLTSATPNESALRPEGGETSATDASSTTAAEPEPATTASTAADDPQEQPFERDGRWWFRRGDELLVYEEQTGQWVAAPGEPSTSGSVAAPSATASATSAEPAAGAAEGQVTTQQETAGSFWKCPSCGAVNGSTATSCRMCFTARP